MTFPSRTTSIAATALAAVASTLAYPFLPERVATHFDADGQPDRYGSRVGAVTMLPAVMAGAIVANDHFSAWPGGADRTDSLSGRVARDRAMGLVSLSLLVSHATILARGMGMKFDMARVSRAMYGVLLVALGNVLPTLPRNGLVGIRTPWTLGDPIAWERTHRVAGYLVMGAGLATLASLPSTGKRAERVPIAATLVAVASSVAYTPLERWLDRRAGRHSDPRDTV